MKLGKKLLSLLTVLCLTLSLFPTMALATGETVNVGGISLSEGDYLVNGANDKGTTAPDGDTGYIYFNPSTKDLELHNCNRAGEIYKTSGDLKIVLYGTNNITSGSNGINSAGKLTISGPGSLTLTAAQNTTIYAQDTITIQGGAKVTAPCGQDGQSIHLNEDNKEIIITGEDTEVTASNGSNSKAGEIRCGASSYSSNTYTGTIQLNDRAKLTATTINGTLKVNGTVQNNPVSPVTAPSTTSGYTVSGKVIDSNSQPIAGASVQLSCSTDTATTAEDGTYRLSDIPNGTYTITASKTGYNATSGTTQVTVRGSNVTEKNITLTPVSYGISVQGTPVTGANMNNVLGDGTVTYTPDTNTLTLNRVNITNTTENTSGIKASNDLTIALIGENNTISGSGHAIHMTNGTLTITGPGSLNASSDSGQTTIYAGGNVIINSGAKITAINTSTSNGDAIHLYDTTNKNLTITGNNTQVIAQKSGSATAINGVDTLAVSDGAMLTAQSNGTAISCTTFSPGSNSSVKVAGNYNGTGANDYSNSANLNSYKYVAVQPKGTTSTTYTVTLTSGTGYTLSAAQDPSSPVTSGGSYSFTLDIADSYKRGNNFAVKANGSELTAGADGQYTISNIRENQTITVEGVVEITKYQVWVNGTQVTEANKDNVLGDNSNSHSVIYTPANQDMPAILTLNNANIVNMKTPTSGEMYYISPNGITAKEDLKINVIGTNTIESEHGNPINATKNLTISDSNTANNSLELKSKDNMTVLSLDYTGPYNLIISGSVNVKAIVETNVIAATSVSANKMIIQDNAKVTAINHGKNMAIYCRDALTVKDSATLIAQSENNNHAVTVENGFTYPGHIIEASENFAGTNPDETYNPEKLDPGVNKTGYRYVEVRPTSGTVITGIKLNKELSMKVGTTDTLTPVFTPANATEQTVTWTSSDKTVATVDQNGKVTAVGVGTATITVLTKDGHLHCNGEQSFLFQRLPHHLLLCKHPGEG